jgi:hypothetical protein
MVSTPTIPLITIPRSLSGSLLQKQVMPRASTVWVGVMYQNGWGVEPNDELAIKYYAMAAEQGIAEAMLALGRHFSMDFSESYNPVEAYKWYSLAAKLNVIDANAKREYIADGDALVGVWSNGHKGLFAK